MAERLGKVAREAFGARVVLFAEQPHIVPQRQQPLEQRLRLLRLPFDMYLKDARIETVKISFACNARMTSFVYVSCSTTGGGVTAFVLSIYRQ